MSTPPSLVFPLRWPSVPDLAPSPPPSPRSFFFFYSFSSAFPFFSVHQTLHYTPSCPHFLFFILSYTQSLHPLTLSKSSVRVQLFVCFYTCICSQVNIASVSVLFRPDVYFVIFKKNKKKTFKSFSEISLMAQNLLSGEADYQEQEKSNDLCKF